MCYLIINIWRRLIVKFHLLDPVQDEVKLKSDFKRTSFDRELRAFITQAQETIKARYGMSLELGDVRPESVCLNRYLSIYNSMDPEEHYRYFETLFGRKRSDILIV